MLVSNLYSVFLLKFTHYNGSLWMQRFTQYFEFSLLSFFYCVLCENMINIFITTDHKNTKTPLKNRKVDCDDPQPTSTSDGNGT